MRPSRVIMCVAILLWAGLAVLAAGGARERAAQAQGDYDCAAATGIPQVECEALVAFYHATGGENWYVNTGWLQTTTPCGWYGVTCASGRVTGLFFPSGSPHYSNHLIGAIPPEIGDLTALTLLSLSVNGLTALPPEIGKLTALTGLDLSVNPLTALPPEIGNLSALTNLDLRGDKLASLPPEFGNLAALTSLDLGSNQLQALPSEIGNLTALASLGLGGNQLTALPAEIGNLAALVWLDLTDNQLTALPPEIGNLTALTELSLLANLLTALPPEIGNLTGLTSLCLSGNQLTALPLEIGGLTALTSLDLSGNQLTALPAEIGDLAALGWLDLSGNQLAALPPAIGDLTGLGTLGLRGNRLTALPPEIGNLTGLGWLDLSDNRLTALPSEIGSLTGLTGFFLSDNRLAALPPEIGKLTALLDLDFRDNQLGTLPPEFGNLIVLHQLDLSGNRLTALAPQIGNLGLLSGLDLSRNQLTALPQEIEGWANLASLDLSDNQLASLPPEIGKLAVLVELDLGRNQLTALPPEVGDTPFLGALDLGDNQLGALPPQLANSSRLYSLDVHANPLSGALPTVLTALTSLSSFQFYGTGWCVPATGEVPLWLTGIGEVYGTGQVCGQAPGGVGGHVTQPDGSPAPGAQVSVYRFVPDGTAHVTTTYTSAAGTYRVGGLGEGIDYRVWFADPAHAYAPEYYDDQPTQYLATPVTVTLGLTRTGINAVLNPPHAPLADVATDSGSVLVDPWDGMLIVHMPASARTAITVTRAVTCAAGVPTDVTLRLTPPGSPYPMTPLGGNRYRATIAAAELVDDAALSIAATCDGTISETFIGQISLYDPTGTVADAGTGGPVAGASVTLYHVRGWRPKNGPQDDRPHTCQSEASKAPGAPWSQPAPKAGGVVVNPEVTPVEPPLVYQRTGAEGTYGWDLDPWNSQGGCWFVRVTAAGYFSLTGPLVGAPPAVTGLDLALTPLPRIVKTAAPLGGLHEDDALTYTLTLYGAGLVAVLRDPLPAGVRFVPGSLTSTLALPAVYSPTAHAVVWAGVLPTGTLEGVQFQVTRGITGEGSLRLAPPILNTAWLTATETGQVASASVIVNGHWAYLPVVLRSQR